MGFVPDRTEAVVIWTVGRLDEFRRDGLIGGGNHRNTIAGNFHYEMLVGNGFTPSRTDVKAVIEVVADGADAETRKMLLTLVMATESDFARAQGC